MLKDSVLEVVESALSLSYIFMGPSYDDTFMIHIGLADCLIYMKFGNIYLLDFMHSPLQRNNDLPALWPEGLLLLTDRKYNLQSNRIWVGRRVFTTLITVRLFYYLSTFILLQSSRFCLYFLLDAPWKDVSTFDYRLRVDTYYTHLLDQKDSLCKLKNQRIHFKHLKRFFSIFGKISNVAQREIQ